MLLIINISLLIIYRQFLRLFIDGYLFIRVYDCFGLSIIIEYAEEVTGTDKNDIISQNEVQIKNW
jgi:hypothetical protein